MKVRNGFVSNSSSSSFLMYGTYVDRTDEMEDKAKNVGLEIQYGGETGGYVLGKSMADIGDDQTGKQFKEEIEKKIKEVLGSDKELEFGMHSESWYNG